MFLSLLEHARMFRFVPWIKICFIIHSCFWNKWRNRRIFAYCWTECVIYLNMRKLVPLFLAFLCSFSFSGAQRVFNFPMGQVSDNRFHAISEDLSGFIWIGTENGLNRYDGYRFFQFYHDDEDSLSLRSNYIRSLYCDSHGTLWIGTNRGLQYLKPGENSFHNVTLSEGTSPYIQQICQFRDGRIWIAAPGLGVYWVDTSNPDESHSIVSLNTLPESDFSNMYRALLEDNNGTIWIGTPTGVLLYDPYTDRLTEFQRSVIDRDVTGINMDRSGNIFITTKRHVYVWNSIRRSLDRLTPPEGIWEITHAFMDTQNRLVVSIRGKGLLYLNDERKLTHVQLKSSDHSLEKLDVSAMYCDKAGNQWIGCFLSDLILVTKERNDLSYWKFSDYAEDISGTVTALVTDNSGCLWIGYNNNGLTRMASNGSVILENNISPFVGCFFRDSNGRIWVGHPSGGLSILNTATGQMDRVITNDYSNISSIAEDQQGRIYYSELGTGFSRFDPKDMKIEVYTDFAKRGVRDIWLSNDWIHTLFIDSSNRLWIGHDNGVDCFDIEQSSFVNLGKLKNRIGTAGCTSFVDESENNNLWIGTTRGIIVYNTETGTTRMIDHGLTDYDIRSLVKDSDGYIWASTRNGLNRISPRTLESTRFYTEEKAFNRVSAVSDSDGMIYFGSNFGITRLDPDAVRNSETVNMVSLTGLYVNGELINSKSLSGGKRIVRGPVSRASSFRLANRDNSFTLEFSTLNYGSEMNIIYEYTFNRDKLSWTSNPAGVNRITFSNLHYGRYDLSVRARLNDIVSEPRTYTIRIDAPWYATVWAWIIYAILFGILLMLILRSIKKSREREMDEARFQSFINVAHEICAPMTMVISPLEDMLADDNVPEDMQIKLRQMQKSSTRILTLVNQLLDMRKYDEGRMQLHFAETDLVNFLMGPFELFTQTAERHNIDFSFTHSMPELPVWIDRDSIDKVMMNLLSNAFKYTPDNGKIEIGVEAGTDENEKGPLHNYAEITVTDTGVGLDKDEINKVFDRFHRAENELTSVTMGMGIGLNYSQMLVNMHHGIIKAANRDDGQKGSIFSFRLPLGNNHIDPELIVPADKVVRQQLERSRQGIDLDELNDKTPSKGTMKLLVVDDDESMLDYISASLKNSYKILTARNGKEGLKIAVSQRPDIIVTDVVMPEMDGIELVKSLKGNSLVSHIPVIMLSGKNKLQDRMLGLETGADSYLPKPFYMSELKSLIANLINNRLIVKGKYSGKLEQKEKVASVHFESSDELLMKRIMEIVNKNLSNSDFNITQLVGEVGLSRTQLHRKIKELTGFPASKFVQNIRMQQAMKLLRDKRINVSQIAYSVGFSSQTHFSTTFKQYYGISPTEYIRQIEAEEQK